MSRFNAPFLMHSSSLASLDPGNAGTILCDRNPQYVGLVSATAETRTLAAPTKRGVIITLAMETDGGDITLTVTGGYNENGDTTFTFSDPGQSVTFLAVATVTGGVSTLVWRKISDYNTGNVATPVNGIAAGYKLARGVTTITGSGTVVTGLATVVAVTATMQADASLTNGITVTGTIGDQAGSPAAGSVILKVWKPTASGDVTPIASAAAVAVNWIAVGT